MTEAVKDAVKTGELVARKEYREVCESPKKPNMSSRTIMIK